MRRRWSRAAVVACIAVLLAAACAEPSRPPPRRLLAAAAPWEDLSAADTTTAGTSGDRDDDGPRRSAFDVLVEGLVTIGLGRRWRAGGDPLVDQDKRRVPTGPNPLHNR
uniref:Uncharacterized protein n=1 Tax=Avena sativa TaxID=4498 RepID=A0ACD5UFV2_AVESA